MAELTTYDDVNNAWGRAKLPPISATAATSIFKKLVRKYGGRRMRLPSYAHRVNRSWAAPAGSDTSSPRAKGLPRMVHDASHWVFYKLHPTFKSHSAAHADLEKQMIECVLASGWHVPKPVSMPAADDVVSAELANVEARIKRWQTKAKRAATALRNLDRKAKNLRARLA